MSAELSIGVIQGRLTPSRGRGIQFFPAEDWEREFDIAREIGLRHIQWVFDAPENPLLDATFRSAVKETIKRGVPVRHADLQFLVSRPIESCTIDIFKRISEALADVDAKCVEIPALESSSLLVPERDVRLAAVGHIAEAAREFGLSVSIETDPPPQEMRTILDTALPIGIVYDSGNSAGMGYNVEEELAAYISCITNVHIKDKKKGGGSVALGTGDADFTMLFRTLRREGYNGPTTLQAARGVDGREVETVQEQIAFIQSHYAE